MTIKKAGFKHFLFSEATVLLMVINTLNIDQN